MPTILNVLIPVLLSLSTPVPTTTTTSAAATTTTTSAAATNTCYCQTIPMKDWGK